MTMVKTIVIAMFLAISGLYASGNYDVIKGIHSSDYYITVDKQKHLTIGKNDLRVKVEHKMHRHDDLNISLKLFTKDGKTTTYNFVNVDNGIYTFNIDLNHMGKYGYLIKFNQKNGGVIHYVRGSFKM